MQCNSGLHLHFDLTIYLISYGRSFDLSCCRRTRSELGCVIASTTCCGADAINIPGVATPVGLAMAANVAVSNGNAVITFNGSTTTPITFSSFSFVQINSE